MDAVEAFIANGEATEPGERALDDPAEHAKAAALGRAATAEDRRRCVRMGTIADTRCCVHGLE